MPLIIEHLGQQVRSGTQVILGTNPWIGLESNYKMSHQLLDVIRDGGIDTLHQATSSVSNSLTTWSLTQDFWILAYIAFEWDSLISQLNKVGIFIIIIEDKLLQTNNCDIGIYSPNASYKLLHHLPLIGPTYQYWKHLWKLPTPLNVILHTWFILKKVVPTQGFLK